MQPYDQNVQQLELNIVGSSTFGRYPKISIEKTFNMLISDGWLVDYAGYKLAIRASKFANATEGRGIHVSTKFDRIIAVFDNNVYLINLEYDQATQQIVNARQTLIGTLNSATGVVYITENNKPQIVISDTIQIYYYDPTLSPTFQIATEDGTNPISFAPGFIDFHDTYILCAASNDTLYTPPANNTWRLGAFDSGSGKLVFADNAASVGLIQTKPDNTQAVVRFPSRGNQILVLGQTVCEAWYNVGYQLFPYQRSTSFSIDYGCLNPASIASTDEIVVWLAQNEKSGPIIVYTTGGNPQKITTDGIDFLFSQLTDPADCQGFIYRQDGHLIYHINFYTDNLSLFYDFNTQRFFNASDENLNYFIAGQVAFFRNQYYFITKNNGNLYAFDTVFTTYDGSEIPRIRTCKSVRNVNQNYFSCVNVGFTIETGETPYQEQDRGNIFLITQDGKYIIAQPGDILFVTQLGDYIQTQDGKLLRSQQADADATNFLIAQQNYFIYTTPRIDLSISIDGGQSFSSDMPYVLLGQGKRRNRLMWWQLGAANDLVCQFRFWGIGRFVAYEGVANVRT